MLIEQTKTAAISYVQSKQIVSTINDRVLDYIKEHQPCSRNDVQRALNLSARQSGCSVWHLIEQGKVRVKPMCFKEDVVTKRMVEVVEINPTPEIIFRKVSDKEKLEKVKELCDNASLTDEIDEYESFRVFKNNILSIINS